MKSEKKLLSATFKFLRLQTKFGLAHWVQYFCDGSIFVRCGNDVMDHDKVLSITQNAQLFADHKNKGSCPRDPVVMRNQWANWTCGKEGAKWWDPKVL